MSTTAFADVVHQTIYFREKVESEALVLKLIDTPWIQRLRDISQTGSTSLVYMFSEHSRFGHSIGVAYLANYLLDHLTEHYPDEIKPYRNAVSAAALLHDIGHLAPGSHTAFKTWFPDLPDSHEALSVRIIREDPVIRLMLNEVDPKLADTVCAILEHADSVPPWTWEVISGSGWNIDRGNWCIVDSVMAGVSYGRYNIPALVESVVLTPDRHLAVRENRLDAVMHFTIARHSMYRQVYFHRVLLAAETLCRAVVDRARDLGEKLIWADDALKAVLSSKSALNLDLSTIAAMRESWWRYHLYRWMNESDPVLKDLSFRLLNRKLFKTVRVREDDDPRELMNDAAEAVKASGFDPRYYLHRVEKVNTHVNEYQNSMRVLMDTGEIEALDRIEPVWNALSAESIRSQQIWLALPQAAKERLGRKR